MQVQRRYLYPILLMALMLGGSLLFAQTPQNFKIAFVGDSGIGSNAEKVFQMIKGEGTQAVVHAGDLDYYGRPQQFESFINRILGENFPYFYSVGNHDAGAWKGTNGYQGFLERRFQRLGITWDGTLGVQSSFSYKGIFFVVCAPSELGITPRGAANYIKNQLSRATVPWRIAFWHKNQRDMQVGGKGNEAGWGVYEESRKGGAIVATGHEHSYSRSYLMKHMQRLQVDNTTANLVLAKDNPATAVDEGRTFAFVSGISGKSIRSQQIRNHKHWGSIYTSTQRATYGALFGVFNYNGQRNMAKFYFKNINGQIIDEFMVRTTSDGVTPIRKEKAPQVEKYSLEQNYPNPFNPSTVISYTLPKTSQVSLKVYDIAGQEVKTLVSSVQNAGSYEVTFDASKLSSGIYFYHLESEGYKAIRKMMFLK